MPLKQPSISATAATSKSLAEASAGERRVAFIADTSSRVAAGEVPAAWPKYQPWNGNHISRLDSFRREGQKSHVLPEKVRGRIPRRNKSAGLDTFSSANSSRDTSSGR